jgi:hypothetical protein
MAPTVGSKQVPVPRDHPVSMADNFANNKAHAGSLSGTLVGTTGTSGGSGLITGSFRGTTSCRLSGSPISGSIVNTFALFVLTLNACRRSWFISSLEQMSCQLPRVRAELVPYRASATVTDNYAERA